MPAPRPPHVDGVLTAGPDMTRTLLEWSRRGFQHTLSRPDSPTAARRAARMLLIAWWSMWPLLYVIQRLLLARPNARYYLSADQTAVLAIVARRNTWMIEDHLSSDPGTGQGQRLRDALLPALLAECDRLNLAVEMSTAVPELSTLYTTALPGLTDVGRAYPRGRKLRREPADAPARWPRRPRRDRAK